MEIFPRVESETLEKESENSFIRVDLDKAGEEDFKKLEESGWAKGHASTSGELTFDWKGEGEPKLPEELVEKIIGNTDGKIEHY